MNLISTKKNILKIKHILTLLYIVFIFILFNLKNNIYAQFYYKYPIFVSDGKIVRFQNVELEKIENIKIFFKNLTINANGDETQNNVSKLFIKKVSSVLSGKKYKITISDNDKNKEELIKEKYNFKIEGIVYKNGDEQVISFSVININTYSVVIQVNIIINKNLEIENLIEKTSLLLSDILIIKPDRLLSQTLIFNITHNGIDFLKNNLKNQDLRYRNFKGANLKGFNFSRSNITKTNFTYANISYANFEETVSKETLFNDAIIDYTNFMKAMLEQSDFTGVKGKNPVFSFAKIYKSVFNNSELVSPVFSFTHIKETSFVKSKLINAVFKQNINFFSNETSSHQFKYSVMYNDYHKERSIESQNSGSQRADIIGCDFTGADIKGSNFYFAIVQKSNFSDADISNSNLSKSIFNETKFIKAKIIKSDFTKAMFLDCDLTQTNLFKAVLNFTDFKNINAKYANFSESDFKAANLSNVNFQHANLSKAILKHTKFKKSDFTGADISDVDLRGHDLRGQNFTRTNFTNSNLEGVNLTETNFEGGNLTNTNLNHAKLNKANLNYTTITGAKLRFADLSKAVLNEANLDNTDFSEANVENAVFDNSSLKNANFAKTNMVNTRFKSANMKNTNLSDVKAQNAFFQNARISDSIMRNGDFRKADFRSRANLNGADKTLANFEGALFDDPWDFNANLTFGDGAWGWLGLEFQIYQFLTLSLKAGYSQMEATSYTSRALPVCLFANLYFSKKQMFRPYISFGGGYAFNLTKKTDSLVMFFLLAGLEYNITGFLTLFAEVGGIYSSNTLVSSLTVSNNIYFTFGGGVKFYF